MCFDPTELNIKDGQSVYAVPHVPSLTQFAIHNCFSFVQAMGMAVTAYVASLQSYFVKGQGRSDLNVTVPLFKQAEAVLTSRLPKSLLASSAPQKASIDSILQRLGNTSIKNAEHGLNVIASVLLDVPQWQNYTQAVSFTSTLQNS